MSTSLWIFIIVYFFQTMNNISIALVILIYNNQCPVCLSIQHRFKFVCASPTFFMGILQNFAYLTITIWKFIYHNKFDQTFFKELFPQFDLEYFIKKWNVETYINCMCLCKKITFNFLYDVITIYSKIQI